MFLDPRGFLGMGLASGDCFCQSCPRDWKLELEDDPVCIVDLVSCDYSHMCQPPGSREKALQEMLRKDYILQSWLSCIIFSGDLGPVPSLFTLSRHFG